MNYATNQGICDQEMAQGSNYLLQKFLSWKTNFGSGIIVCESHDPCAHMVENRTQFETNLFMKQSSLILKGHTYTNSVQTLLKCTLDNISQMIQIIRLLQFINRF